MRIAVIALGKIGLPLAVQFASKQHDVIGCDIDERTVHLVNQGTPPFPGEAQLDEKLKAAIQSQSLHATTDFQVAVSAADVVVIVVPLFVDNEGTPDFAAMDQATIDVAAHIPPNTLICYETTLPVGTTRERFVPILESRSGYTVGQDLFVAFSPERVFSGRIFSDLQRYPKLVGGIDDSSTKRAIEFYEAVLDFDERPDLNRANGVWDLGSAEAAEMAKLAETTYRDVNIGLANQFARFADAQEIDVYQVIEAANSQPFSHIHQPGIAVGGHCIPIYPRFYLWNDPSATIVQSARDANSAMPAYAVSILADTLGSLTGLRVAVLGAAYRGGVKETAFSGVFATVAALEDAGATVLVHDPLYSAAELTDMGFDPYEIGAHIDAAIIQTNHDSYVALQESDLPGVRVIVDGRRITNPANFPATIHRVLGQGENK